jgi:hypothetical protein
MRGPNSDYISMKSLRGRAKICCLTSEHFRDDVIIMARAHGIKLQDLLLMALRDKVYADRKAKRTAEGRRRLALEALFQSKTAPQELKDAIDALLAKYLPRELKEPVG